MKNIALTVLVFLFIAPGLHSQNRKEKIKVYKVWVTKMDGSKQKGFFYAADEKGITISKSKTPDKSKLVLVEAKSINIIKIRRKGAVGKGAGIGFLSGAAVGAIIGFADGDEFLFPKEAKAGIAGAFIGVIGTGVGAIVGTGKKKILIDGNAETYRIQLNSLTNYTLTRN